MLKLWQNYNQDLPPLTGQTREIPMLLSQQHSNPTTAGSNSPATLAQWRIGVDHPGDLICTGPKYQYAYVNDQIHLTNPDYERLRREVRAGDLPARRSRGTAWQPLQPTASSATAASSITVALQRPGAAARPGIRRSPMPHQSAFTEWAQGRGFEVRSGTTRVSDQPASRSPATTVQITLRHRPARLRASIVGYASTTDANDAPNGDRALGAAARLRPVRRLADEVASPLCVAFEMDVPDPRA